MPNGKWRGIACLAGMVFCGVVRAANYPYTLTDLGTLPGGGFSYAYGINDVGQIVGSSDTGQASGYALVATTDSHAFLYNSGEGMTDLGALPGDKFCSALGINNSGQIVGVSSAALVAGHAFLYSATGGMTNLGSLPGGGEIVVARGINDSGQVVGWSDSSSGIHAFVYSSDGGMTDLGTLAGGDFSEATAINNSGQIVGGATSSGTDDGVVFLDSSSTGMISLGNLPGGGAGDYSYAYGINDAGQIVGQSDLGNGDFHAFLYNSAGGMTDLGTLGGADSQADGINNSAEVVGYSYTASGMDAFLYENGNIVDLNSLIDPASGWTLQEARAINDSGEIVGYGINSAGQTDAFLLTPVPTPGASAIGMGLLGFIGVVRGRIPRR